MKPSPAIRLFVLLCGMLLCGAHLSAGEAYNFRSITTREGMPSSVRCIHAEKRGFVWIGSSGEGLVRYDNYLPRRYLAREGDEHALPGNHIIQIVEDSLAQIWVLTNRGLARYRPASDDFFVPKRQTENGSEPLIVQCALPVTGGVLFGSQNQIFRYDYTSDRIEPLLSFATERPYPIQAIYPWEGGLLLCFNRWHGLLLLDPRSGEVRRPDFASGKENMAILVDAQGRIWLSPYNRGIECYDLRGRCIARYDTRNSALSNDVVLCMIENEGRIWIGTDGGGINILDPADGSIEVLKHTPGDVRSLPGNSVLSLYRDPNGTVWAGRVRGGLFVIRRSAMRMYVGTSPMKTNGLSDESVLCLYRDPGADEIWIGTDGGGIDRFDPRTGRFTHFQSTFGYKIASIAGLSDRELLLSVFSRGLFAFDRRSGALRPVEFDDSLLRYQMSYSGQSVNLLPESPTSVLLLSRPLHRYHLDTKRMETLDSPEGLNSGFPVATFGGSSYFHDQRHIYRVRQQARTIEPIFEIGRDSLISSVACSGEGVFWIVTDRGILRYSPAAKCREQVPIPYYSRVQSIVCDTRGRVWTGTDQGVFAWLPDLRRFIPFGESEGAAWNEFQAKARLATPDGDVYLGGIEGLLQVDGNLFPESLADTADAPEIEPLDILLDGERLDNLPEEETVDIPWTNKSLVVRIRVRENDLFRKRLYRFRVTGDSYREVIDSYDPELTLRNLVPGDYLVEATCNTRDGEWTPWKAVLSGVVSPPWYKTGWFTALWILAAAGAILGLFVALLHRKEVRLQRELEQHKQQIAEEKVRFLINISHELRTPLTLILGPLGRLVRTSGTTDDDRPLLRRIYKQAQRMKELINMVLTLRKMETGTTTLHPQLQELNRWVEGVVEDFRLEADERGIELRVEADPRIGERSFDAGKCLIVLSNLMINALKHSPDRSRITVRTQLDEARNCVRISVIDCGCGLKGVDTDRLFTRFYQGDNERTGSGIGLSYAKILVEQHGGRIGAGDNPEGGAVFYFELPAELSDEQIVCRPRNYLNELLTTGSPVEQPVAEADLSQLSLLIVEDDEELITYLRGEFEPRTRRLFTARDGVEALAILEREEVDAVVSDVMMPRMDGYELCRQVKSRIAISHIPVVLLTARNDERSQLLGYNNGADAYMAKPFEVEMLAAVVVNLLRNRSLIRDRYREPRAMPTPQETAFSSADEEFLTRLRKLVEENLQQVDFNIPYLCREIGMSRTVLYNKLKLLTGLNVKEYVNKIRIERACRLITETGLSITEVAEQTGFSSARYFSTAFKQYMGVTPTQYKAKSA